MRLARWAALCALTTLILSATTSALALSGVPGGIEAPSAPQVGASQHVAPARAVERPVVSALTVAKTATAGRPPSVRLRIDEHGVGTVYVQVTLASLTSHAVAVTATLGWSHTGRTLTVRWPTGATLSLGSYRVSVSAYDHHGGTLLRTARSSGEATLTISAPSPTPTPPSPPVVPTPVTPEAGVPTPAQTAADGAVFPVAGAHNFGGPENRFGAPRSGYLHQGQDILTTEGTPIVAPLPGTVLTTSYQAGGAGYYAVERTTVGFDLMFAHCQAESLAVSTGQAVSAGQTLCRAGQTGDATTPHVDFEMWVGGWQASSGHPIDPLPYLEAWEHES